MPATIYSETHQTVTEKGAKIENCQIARKFNLGSWIKARIGVRFFFNDAGAAPSSGAVLFFGLNNGTTNLPGDASCSHFVGHRIVTAATGVKASAWTRNSFLNNYSEFHPAALYCSDISKLVGTTYTNLGGTISPQFGMPTGTGPFIGSHLFIDYTRISASTMDVRLYYPNSSAVNVAISSLAQFKTAMESADPVAQMPVNSLTAGTNRAGVAVNEATDGTLDTICFGWDRSSPFIVVDDIAIVRHQ